jgi:glycogen debranching enzyme
VGEAEAFANAWPTPGEAGQEGELREPLAAIEVEWRPGEQAPILVVAGGAIGIEASVVEATHVLSDAASSFLRAREETEALLSEAALVEGPDTAWNEAYRWAVAMLARFEVDSPGVGRGLMAGFEASRPGWFRARPGYAWYFGRDAVWTGFALDALGRFEMVERALDLLASYQEFTGKIFHELTPTGSIHYDAADATPLYLVALAHHLRWSGNLGFVRAHEEPARRALRFLRATDSDGDRLIENTEVGHGWIEGGKLHGGHTTFYLAGIGVEALRSAGELFEALGEPEEAARARDEAAEVRAILERDFWDSSAGAYFYSKLQDGSFRSAPTILPAVPMGFGWLDEERAAAYLDFLAGSDITADWGARILARSHPAYNPVGYHEGSVWPLFSGWAALAEYRHHRPESAFFHVAQTLATFRHGNLGAIEEVFRGDRYEPRGITSHQAWSESLPLQAVVEGMLGARPDALRHTLRLEPHLPPSWGNLRVSNLRVGQGLLALHVEEKSAGRVTCRLTGRGVARVELALAFPPGSRPLAVRRRGAPSPFRVVATRDDVHVEVVLEGLGSSETVEFDIDRGPSLEIPLPALIPGDPSRGLRFIRKRLGGGRFEVTLEGVAGQRYEVTAWDVQDRTVWEGAEVLGREGRRTRLAVDVPGSDGEYRRATLAALFDP